MKGRLFNPTVVTLVAWACLSPFFLLLLAVLDTHQMPETRKLWFLLGALLLWVLLPIGSGLLWKKEAERQISLPQPKPASSTLIVESLEALRTLSPAGLQSLCLRVFQGMWPEVKAQPLPQGLVLLQHQGKRLLLACEAQKTFIGTQEIENFMKSLRQLNCQKGYYMTTGLFSLLATRKAASSVELIDGEKLYELALTFVKREEEPPRYPERRRAPRLPLTQLLDRETLQVALSIPYEPSASKGVRLENISEGGFCAFLERADQLPKFFHLTLCLPTVEDSIHTLGELIWRQRQGAGSEERCGVAFLSMGAQDRTRLRRFIERQQTMVVNEGGKNG